jgi:hypothetical protein
MRAKRLLWSILLGAGMSWSVVFAAVPQMVSVSAPNGNGLVFVRGSVLLADGGTDTCVVQLVRPDWRNTNAGVFLIGSLACTDTSTVSIDGGPTSDGPWSPALAATGVPHPSGGSTLKTVVTVLTSSASVAIPQQWFRIRRTNRSGTAATSTMWWTYGVR